MKKLSIMLVVLVLISIFPVSAQNTVAKAPSAVAITADAELDVSAEVKAEAEKKTTVLECTKLLKNRYPRVDGARIVAYCRNLIANSNVGTKQDVKARLITAERVRTLKNVNEAQKAKLMALNARQKARLRLLSNARLESVASLNDEQVEKLTKLDRSRIRECAHSENITGCLEKYRIKRFANKADLFRVRTVKNYGEIRTKLSNLKQAAGEIRADLNEERAAFREAVESGDEEAAEEHAKAYLLEVADYVTNGLEKIKANVQENDDLTEEEVDEIVEDIDAKIKVMTEAKAEVEAAEGKEEIKQAGSKVIRAWATMKSRIRLHSARAVKASVNDVLMRAEYLERRLDSALARLEEEGYNVSSADELIVDFDLELESARANFKLASEKFMEARKLAKENNSTDEEIEELVEEGKELTKQAHEDLKDAHELSKEIIGIIRETSGSLDVFEEEDEEDFYLVEEVEEQ